MRSRVKSSSLSFAILGLASAGCRAEPERPNNTFTTTVSSASASESSSDTDSNSASGSSDETTTSDGSEETTGLKFDQGSLDSAAPSCDPDQITDTTAFSFVKTIDVGIDTLQAGFFDSTRERVVVFSFFGQGKLIDIDGNIIGDVMAPPEALPKLDGGAYDLANDLALLITQDCNLVEVDPETFQTVQVLPLAMAHGVSVCAGLAIDPIGNLYVTSYGTDELVVLDRSAQLELLRVDMLAIGLPGFDGIAEIAGSENFLVNSTTQLTAGIIAADGTVVVPPGAVGDTPLMGGGLVGQPDAMLTICLNGHTWVCDAYETTCSDFSPSDGDKTACGCLVVG